MQRITIAIVSLHVVLALWSGYRAIWQVIRLELVGAAAPLTAGSTVGYDVLSSGRVPVTVLVELIQGARADTLARDVLRQGVVAGWDPRLVPARRIVTLDSARLAPFQPGAAIVRVTALGRSQFLRTPPPEVRERAVPIVR